MLILITYDVKTVDIKGRRRLAKVARICENYGQRVQNSVFECDLDSSRFVFVRNELLKIIDEDNDSLRIYNLGNKYSGKIEHFGVKESYNPEGDIFL